MDKQTKVRVPISNDGKPFEVKVTRSIQRMDIADLLVSALEGGSNYWIRDIKVKKAVRRDFKYDTEERVNHTYEAPLNPGGNIRIQTFDSTRYYFLDELIIEQGLKRMAEKHPDHMNDFINENADAATADVFVQLCIFGEVIYG